ncbi:MAG TPA: choice-of-anchor Q domain-containing protein [Bryobacteraceae bacterium]|nr:choice-of-anchor Q domain-containing protein [Bryobacteraceae bacterium]HPT26826.1 choice-of-anchor Q domain-containing protein [Bryobacteraceae bacterium]
MRYTLNPILSCLALTLAAASAALAAGPVIFFSDLESGPNSGGQGKGGAFVTIYGRGFGATRGSSTVTIGGGAAVAYPTWTDQKVAFQLGSSASSGNIVVTTTEGTSNGVPFTVRPGRILFVSATGRDSGSGSFTSPWKSLLKARDSAAAGDIIYAMNGVSQPNEDGQGWRASILFRRGGSPGKPIALVAYPGATVTIGTVTGPDFGIRTTDFSSGEGACSGHWVFAGLTLRGKDAAMALAGPSQNWRVVGNDMSCPNGNGAAGCFEVGGAKIVRFLGNNIHNAGAERASALYHGVYFGTDSTNLDIGWNTIAYVRGCRGLHVHSSPLFSGGPSDKTGHNMYDIQIHDNVIHDTQCDGIILATVDPSRGPVKLFNNVIYNAGRGPNTPEQSGNFSCLAIPGSTNNGEPGGGTVEIHHNTFFRCGTHPNPPWTGAVSAIGFGNGNPRLSLLLRNNIFVQPPSVPYLVYGGDGGGIRGSNNLFFGGPSMPRLTGLRNSLSSDPRFVNPQAADFHLGGSSAAIGAGVATGLNRDRDGVARPAGNGADLGAYQSAGQSRTSGKQ